MGQHVFRWAPATAILLAWLAVSKPACAQVINVPHVSGPPIGAGVTGGVQTRLPDLSTQQLPVQRLQPNLLPNLQVPHTPDIRAITSAPAATAGGSGGRVAPSSGRQSDEDRLPRESNRFDPPAQARPTPAKAPSPPSGGGEPPPSDGGSDDARGPSLMDSSAFRWVLAIIVAIVLLWLFGDSGRK